MFTAICRPAIFFSLILLTLNAWSLDKAPKTLAQARSFYRDGNYTKAAAIYESMDPNSRDYLRTREELAWTYLRFGDWPKLRGVLAHLNTPIVPLRWRLEGRVMSSMLHLRECQYEKVKAEMAQFQSEMAPLVKKVSVESERSAHKQYWKALRDEVAEAMLKMKFVKMELRSRLVMLNREQVVDAQSTKGLGDVVPASMQTFPLKDELWIDEVFQARGDGTGACELIHKAKVTR